MPTRSRRSATASARPTGIRATIRRCPTWWRTGKRPDVRACSLCHYPNGKGRPENAGVSGLPVSYFMQTMADFRNGAPEERGCPEGQHERHDHDRQGHDRRGDQSSRRVLRRDEVDAVDQGRRSRRRCRRRASPAACSSGSKATRPSRSASASSRCPRMWRPPKSLRDSALRLHRVRAAGQRQEGRGARHHGRRRQDHAVQRLPRRRI